LLCFLFQATWKGIVVYISISTFKMDTFAAGIIESGSCRVVDRCWIVANRTHAEVINIYYEDIETDSCICGENVTLKLKNVEEEVSFFLELILSSGPKCLRNLIYIYSMRYSTRIM